MLWPSAASLWAIASASEAALPTLPDIDIFIEAAQLMKLPVRSDHLCGLFQLLWDHSHSFFSKIRSGLVEFDVKSTDDAAVSLFVHLTAAQVCTGLPRLFLRWSACGTRE